MKIYERDFSILTKEELEEWGTIKEKEKIYLGNKEKIGRKNLYRQYPKAVRHYLSLFPNNYLDIVDLSNEDNIIEINKQYLNILDNKTTSERTILNFIKEKNAYYIIASLLKSNFNFGHHEAYIIPEFMLGISYRADYLIIGKSSGGYEFVFVELESPYGNIIINNGELGENFRKGLKQVNDWDEWLDAHYSSVSETFMKYKHPDKLLPSEFCKLDKTRIHYVVIAGRRKDFNNKAYRLRRKYQEMCKITLLHYDNLFDSANSIIGELTY